MVVSLCIYRFVSLWSNLDDANARPTLRLYVLALHTLCHAMVVICQSRIIRRCARKYIERPLEIRALAAEARRHSLSDFLACFDFRSGRRGRIQQALAVAGC